MSPSLRRVWVEIYTVKADPRADTSPSLRRVWVEIEEVQEMITKDESHPPCGGCGLKFADIDLLLDGMKSSPSLRRVWVEIASSALGTA